VQGNDAICLCDVSDYGLGSGGKILNQSAYSVESAPCAREVVGLEVCIDGGCWGVHVQVGEVLDEVVLAWFSRLGYKG
jgi:hypothetical protein